MTRLTRLIVVAAAAALTLGACGGDPSDNDSPSDSPKSTSITIGSAAFPENEIIAEIYAQALEAKGVTVKRKFNIGAREIYMPALKRGEIDLIPEYSGNLMSYLNKDATATSPDDIEDAIEDALPDNLELLDAAPAEDKDSLNVTRAFADKHNLKSIEDLAKVKGLRLGANPEFKERSYGIPGLEKVYGVTGVKFVAIPDGGGPKTLKSLLDGDIDVADIYSTTPSIVANDLVTLTDPKNLIAAQNVVPVINDDLATDVVEDALDAVSKALTTEDLLDLNGKNQGPDKVKPAVLAKDWLKAKGLI